MTTTPSPLDEAVARAYFAKCSELGDAVITLEGLNEERKDQVLQCFQAAIAAMRAADPDRARLVEALKWIRDIADTNLEQDTKLRAQGARTLKRIADKADDALLATTKGD